jgi:hypothetical protein
MERGEPDPSFIITHRIGLEDAPAMYPTFVTTRCVHQRCHKPGVGTSHHIDPPSTPTQ